MVTLYVCLAAFVGFTTARANVQLPTPAIAAAGGNGNSVYALTVDSTGKINGTKALASGGAARQSLFDALAWVPNHSSATTTLDLMAADAAHGQILLYASPSYGSSTAVFTFKGSGPPHPTGLAADAAGNVFITSLGSKLSDPGSLWVLPFDTASGLYDLAPVLIDQKFGGAKTIVLAEVLVAGTGATTTPGGTSPPAWNAGDVLVLVGDTFNTRVMVYSKALIYQGNGALAPANWPLNRPIPVAVTMAQFWKKLALPFGMDIWPADATHGVSLLFTTIDGRIIRFDSSQNAFAPDFASKVGLAPQKIKVATYSNTPYAFVAQPLAPSGGRILQFGAPAVSGSNSPVAIVSQSLDNPLALAASNSLASVTACEGQNCSFGPGVTLNITCPVGGCTFPPGATIQQEFCVVAADPRVTATPNGSGGYNWSCGSDPLGHTTLDVANYCPNYPSTVLTSQLCGHSGPTGSGFVVQKGTAPVVDQYTYVADTIFTWMTDPSQYLPSTLYNLKCLPGPNGPITAWAPRSDLFGIEGSIVEGGPAPGSNYFIEDTGLCDGGGHATKSASMIAFGLGLNVSTTALPSYVDTKFNNLLSTLSNAQTQITSPPVYSTLVSEITTAKNYFDAANYDCALNELSVVDQFVVANQTSFIGLSPQSGGNPNLYGEVWQRTNNLYLTTINNFTSLGPNTTLPPNNVPGCNAAQLNQPSGLAFSPSNGYLYAANYGAGQVLVYAPGQNGQMVLQPGMTIGGVTSGLVNPVRLSFAPLNPVYYWSGYLLVADTGSNTVGLFDTAGSPQGAITGLTRPLGVAFDNTGHIYVAENEGQGNVGAGNVNDIKVYSIGEGITLSATYTQDAYQLQFQSVGTLAYNGTDILVGLPSEIAFYTTAALTNTNCPAACPLSPDPNQTAITSALDGVIGIAIDPKQYVYVTNFYGDPTFSQFAPGAQLTGLSLTGTPSPALQNPQGIALDASGNIYVSNTANNVIDVYHNGGAYWYTIH